MTNDNLYKDRYKIVFDALLVGINVPYKVGWKIFYQNDQLYQAFDQSNQGKTIIHKSAITLSDFMNFVDSAEPPLLKRLYGDIRLFRLQNKLTGNQDEE